MAAILPPGRMWPSLPIPAAVSAHHAGGDVPNACQFNQTLGVQRDGALTEFIAMPPREACIRPDFRGRNCAWLSRSRSDFTRWRADGSTASDTVAIFGCGGVGLGAVAGSSARGARTICVDVEDEKLRVGAGGRRRPCDQQRQRNRCITACWN